MSLLKVDNVTRRFGGLAAVDEVRIAWVMSSTIHQSAIGPLAAGRNGWRYPGSRSHGRRTIFGPRSRNWAGSHRSQRCAGSMTWSSTEMMPGISKGALLSAQRAGIAAGRYTNARN